MKSRTLALVASTALCPLLFAGPALAAEDDASAAAVASIAGAAEEQPADDSSMTAEASGDIVVMARSRAETVQSAPLAITAVGAETLDNHAITSIGQASQLTPGLIAAPGAFVDILYIRGVGTAGTTLGAEQSVGLFIDGVSYGFGRWVIQGYTDLERMEVLRGPQAMYFGKNTVAGAISLYTARPTREFEGYVRAGYEFVADERYVQAVVSGPLTDTLAARLVVKHTEMDGWIKNILPKGPNTPPRGPKGDEQFVRGSLLWTPTEDLKFTFIGSYDNLENNFAQPFLSKCAGPGNTALTSTFGPDPQPCGTKFKAPFWKFSKLGQRNGSDYESYSLTLESVWEADKGTLTSITAQNQVKNSVAFPSNATVNNGVWAIVYFDTKTFSQELRYASNYEGLFNFLIGGFYQNTDFYTENNSYALPDATQGTVNGQSVYTWKRPSTQHGKTYSAFGELNLAFTDQLKLDLGIRYTSDRKRSRLQNTQSAPNVPFITVPIYEASQRFSDWNPSATITYKPSEDHTLFASYRTGFKSGGFSHGNAVLFFPPAPAPALSTFLFNSEKAEGFEGGWKAQLFDRKLRVELVGYYYTYDDLQVTAFNPTNSSFSTQNAAKARTKGIEFSSAWRVTPELTLSGSLNYSDARYLKFIAACNSGAQVAGVAPCNVPVTAPGVTPVRYGQNLGGKRLPLAPEWSGRADATYETDIGDFHLTLGGGVQFSSSYVIGADGRADNGQKSYARWDGRIMFGPSDRRWELALIGNNLTNELVKIGGGERSRSPADLTATYDRARQVELRGTVRF